MPPFEKQIIVKYKEFNKLDSLSKPLQELAKRTISGINANYSPYSKFSVSAGVLLNNSTFHFGGNVENVSYPIGLCAERNVIGHVSTNFTDQKVVAIAIFGKNRNIEGASFISPCGMCRQAILEKERHQKSNITILLIKSATEITMFDSAKDLLPLAFEKF